MTESTQQSTPPPNPARAAATPRSVSLLLYASLITTGLMAGLFYGWDVSVMPGLGELNDGTFVSVMQILIVAIENPPFLLVVLGSVAFPAAAAILLFRMRNRPAARWMAAAFAFSLAAWIITVVVHFPLNDALLAAGEPTAARAEFETPWRIANAMRTVACVLALGCVGRVLSLRRFEQRPRSAT